MAAVGHHQVEVLPYFLCLGVLVGFEFVDHSGDVDGVLDPFVVVRHFDRIHWLPEDAAGLLVDELVDHDE